MRQVTIILMIASLLKLFGCTKQENKTTYPTDEEIFKSFDDFQNRPIFKELTTEIISKIRDEELEQAIFENISTNFEGDTREEIEIIQSLTLGQQAIYVTWIIEAEVNNGGFNQFYFNSSGQFADMGEQSFKTIGALKFADLVRQANKIYEDNKGELEKYDDGTAKSFSESYEDNPLNDLDDKFYKLYTDEPLNKLKIKYIRDNVKEFVTD